MLRWGEQMKPLEAVDRLFRAWEQGDAGAVGDLFCEHGKYEDPLMPKAPSGPEAIRRECTQAMGTLRGVRIETRQAMEEGQRGFVEGFFRSEEAQSGRRFDFSFALLVEMDKGKIARLAEYFDTQPLVGG